MWRKRLLLYNLLLATLISTEVSFGHDNASFRFVENKGQWDEAVRYRARIPGGDLYVLRNSLRYVFYENENKGHHGPNEDNQARKIDNSSNHKLAHSVELTFDKSNIASGFLGRKKLPGAVNYFKGDRSRWVSGANMYSEVVIKGLYEGIDFLMYSSGGALKYDFVVAEGANATEIRMRYKGQNEIKIQDGKLLLNTIHGQIFENTPVSYSISNGRKQAVPSEFVLENGVVGFSFPSGYNHQQRLVIDPELIFSTYSGSFADNWGFTATYDDEGNLYSGGIVDNNGFPTTNGVFQPVHQGDWDVGILKYSPDGKDLIWATYLGGSFSETPQSIIVNNKGQLVIYGTTSSPDFPMTPDT